MNKTNKELAVELTVALINANPRTTFAKLGNGVQDVRPALKVEEVDALVGHFYQTLKSIND